jgi:hypothetical protein
MDRLFIFVLLYAYMLVRVSMWEGMPHDAHMTPTSVETRAIEPIGVAMRERNQAAERVCQGTVAARRACWLSMQVGP